MVKGTYEMKQIYLFFAAAAAASVLAACTKGSVSVAEDDRTYTLDNGIVTAVVAKESGDLVSLRYEGREVLATRLTPDGKPDLEIDPPGANPDGLNRGMTDHQYGFWSHDAMGPRGTRDAEAWVTIDPSTNRGMRAEVAVKGISEGRKDILVVYYDEVTPFAGTVMDMMGCRHIDDAVAVSFLLSGDTESAESGISGYRLDIQADSRDIRTNAVSADSLYMEYLRTRI